MRDAHPLPGTDVVVDGSRWHVVGHGRGGDPPLLLLHGLPTSSYLWHDVMRDLEHDHHCFAPDLLGLGRSERTRAPGDLAGQARSLVRLIEVLGLARPVVVGHDLGGSVAVHLAALAPERVAGLVLIDAPVHAEVWPSRPVLPLLVPGFGETYTALLRRSPRLARAVLAKALGASGHRDAVSARELDHYLQPLLGPDGARGLLRLVRAVDLAAVEAAWRLVRASPPPSLVLWGERDQLLSVGYGRRVAGELPGSSWVPVSEAGHLLPAQRPERVAEELAAFLTDQSRVGEQPPAPSAPQ